MFAHVCKAVGPSIDCKSEIGGAGVSKVTELICKLYTMMLGDKVRLTSFWLATMVKLSPKV
jgi:hypothetical protein